MSTKKREHAVTIRATVALCMGLVGVTGLSQAAPPEASAPDAGRITGIGGVFFKAKDPKALVAWYRDVLGLPLQPWGGAVLRYDAPQHPPVVAWRLFSPTSTYLAPSTAEFMINYAVDDLDAFLAKLAAKGVTPLKREGDAQTGRFAWVMDPEGNKVELWEPKKATSP